MDISTMYLECHREGDVGLDHEFLSRTHKRHSFSSLCFGLVCFSLFKVCQPTNLCLDGSIYSRYLCTFI